MICGSLRAFLRAVRRQNLAVVQRREQERQGSNEAERQRGIHRAQSVREKEGIFQADDRVNEADESDRLPQPQRTKRGRCGVSGHRAPPRAYLTNHFQPVRTPCT
jgi:hypothetical protein